MKIIKLLSSAITAIVMMYNVCAGGSEVPAAQPWPFKMEKVWEIKQIGEEALLRPGEPRVADDGTLYIHDFERKLSYIIDGDGRPVATFASQSNGENEVPLYLNCFPAGDNVVICTPDKLYVFTRQGTYIKSVPNNVFARFPLAFKDENEFWVVPGAVGDAPEGIAAVTHVNLTSGEETVIHEFKPAEDEKKPTGGAVIIGLTPQIKMAFDRQSNRIYFGKNSDTVIYCLAGDKSRAESFSFPGIRRPVSEQDKRNHFAKFNVPEERVARMVGALPDRMTCYNRIQVVDGRVYLFSAESIGDNQSGQVVDVYSPDGRHLYFGKIQVEDGWHLVNPDNLQLVRNFVYTVQENDAGDKKIVKYKITLP